MSVRTYQQVIDTAYKCIDNINKKQELGIYPQWAYYFAKTIISPKTDIKRRKDLKEAPKPTGNYISRQVKKEKYLEMAKYLIWFCEKKGRMPNYIELNSNKKLSQKVYVMMFADIVKYYHKKGKLPSEINVNAKRFIKPTETHNVVYQYFVEKTGKKFTTLDDLLSWMDGRGYSGYYDDVYSNKSCIDRMIDYDGINCVDSLQFVMNMTDEMGYESKCIHVECRSSGTGHVFGKFRHKEYTDNEWITRDPASVLSGNGVRSVWCEDGWLLAENPEWFLENLHR